MATAPNRWDFVKYDGLPQHMQEAAREYVQNGVEPGDFLQAVLCNDLVGACARADSINREYIREWALWLYNEAPSACWRTRAKVDAWIKMHADAREAAPKP